MRIGILTLPLNTNYGGILQAYALQTILERIGHEVMVIDKATKIPSLPLWKCPFIYLKRFINKLLGKKDNIIFLEQYLSKTRPIIQQHTNKFIKKYINRLEVSSYSELSNNNYLDAIVVGSDQIWRPIYWGQDTIEDAFLRFIKNINIKRISYAASFGVDKWEFTPKQTEHCKALLKKFDAVSVREKSGIELCGKYLEVRAQWVLDPTMLLNTTDYMKVFEVANAPESEGTLLEYILDDTSTKSLIIEEIAKAKNLIPFRVGAKTEDIHASLEERIQSPLEKWLRGFYDADFVVTDSFHACVFSILFRKQFIVIGNKKRGMSRITSLLNLFGIEDRLVNDRIDMTNLACIDYKHVFHKLEILKRQSILFLNNTLQ